MELILFGVYVFLGDRANYWCKEHMLHLQGEIILNMQRYIVGRIISAALFGWLTIPMVSGWKFIGWLRQVSSGRQDRDAATQDEKNSIALREETYGVPCRQNAASGTSSPVHAQPSVASDTDTTCMQAEPSAQKQTRTRQGSLPPAMQETHNGHFIVLLVKELIKDIYHGIKSLLNNKKTCIPSIAIFIALCTSGFIVPVVLIGSILFVGVIAFATWKTR